MSLLDHAPQFTAEHVTTIAREVYGLSIVAQELPSERDQNFLLTTATNEHFVLKIANAFETRNLLEAQNEAMQHLEGRVSFCPRVINALSGESITQILTKESPHYVRLITFIEGQPLAKVEQSPALLFNFGASLGKLTAALADFDHEALHRSFHWDLANGLRVITEYNVLFNENLLRQQMDEFAFKFKNEFSVQLNTLPRSIIHGDANDYNVIVDHDRVVGIIDFGDMVHSYRAGELAVALAYVVLDKPDPVACARGLVKGYLSESVLTEAELNLLWPLMLLRLCMSVCMAAYQQQQKPDNEYLDISQRSIRAGLPGLLAIDVSAAILT
ncbi:MAG TPA: phosphotransferase [Pyrinomonadaceae bacterium]